MTRNFKSRLEGLETGGARGVAEFFYRKRPPGLSGPAGVRGQTVTLAEGETVAAFRERCRGMAGPGETIAYALWAD